MSERGGIMKSIYLVVFLTIIVFLVGCGGHVTIGPKEHVPFECSPNGKRVTVFKKNNGGYVISTKKFTISNLALIHNGVSETGDYWLEEDSEGFVLTPMH